MNSIFPAYELRGCALPLRIFAVMYFLIISTPCFANVTNTEMTDTTSHGGIPCRVGERSAKLLSAFFGLDNSLPIRSRLICNGAPGKDGMPVILSDEIDPATMQAGDFQVIKESGATGEITCVTLLPATDAGELRTVLLVGEFGDAETDPPVSVEIVGHLRSIDGVLDFWGSKINVTPLADGPSIVLAEIVDPKALDMGLGQRRTDGSDCPQEGLAQALRVVWSGGVKLANGDEPGDAERDLYSVKVRAADGTERFITPAALADLGDGDNNHLLCLDTKDSPISISFPKGIMADPNGDLNPTTSIAVLAANPSAK
jgi:hypothetical protein